MKYSKRGSFNKRRKASTGRKRLKTSVNSGGYKQYKDPKTGKTKSTHRRVAEKKLGGKIYSGNEVHHIDGNKTNNRPSNLTVIPKSKHSSIHRNKNK